MRKCHILMLNDSMMLIAGWKKFYSEKAVGITRSSSVFKMDHAPKVSSSIGKTNLPKP